MDASDLLHQGLEAYADYAYLVARFWTFASYVRTDLYSAPAKHIPILCLEGVCQELSCHLEIMMKKNIKKTMGRQLPQIQALIHKCRNLVGETLTRQAAR